MDVVFLFPGQGSQYVGMGKAFYEQYPQVKALFEEISENLQVDFRRLCFDGPESTLIRTENVQPAVTLVNLGCLHVLHEEGIVPAAVAGHSLGEYTALFAADVFSLRDTIHLVRSRGRFMQAAADEHPGGMIAVMGLDLAQCEEILKQVQSIGSVEVANHNSHRQVILTGQHEALKAASDIAKRGGAKLVVPLKVSGPWHSRFMISASRKMEEVLAACQMKNPKIPVVSNVTGDFFTDQEEVRGNLVQQIVRPVKWVASIEQLICKGYRTFVEVGPGRVLTGLVRDISKEVKTFNVEKPDDLIKIRT